MVYGNNLDIINMATVYILVDISDFYNSVSFAMFSYTYFLCQLAPV